MAEKVRLPADEQHGWARLFLAIDYIERKKFNLPVVSSLIRVAGLEFNAEDNQEMASRCKDYANRLDRGDTTVHDEILQLICVAA